MSLFDQILGFGLGFYAISLGVVTIGIIGTILVVLVMKKRDKK